MGEREGGKRDELLMGAVVWVRVDDDMVFYGGSGMVIGVGREMKEPVGRDVAREGMER